MFVQNIPYIFILFKLSILIFKVDKSEEISVYKKCTNESNYMVQLIDTEVICGGTLLNERYILTAANCFNYDLNYYTQVNVEHSTKLKSPIEWYSVHKKYSEEPHIMNDIAVVKLKIPFKESEDVSFVTLPPPRCKENILNICKAGKIMGWGAYLGTKLFGQLRCGRIPIIANNACLKENTFSQYTHKSNKNYVCAFSNETANVEPGNICTGDEGGPLMCDDVQIGIAIPIANLDDCGKKSYYSIFTRVDCYLKFIYTSMKDSGGGEFLSNIDLSAAEFQVDYDHTDEYVTSKTSTSQKSTASTDKGAVSKTTVRPKDDGDKSGSRILKSSPVFLIIFTRAVCYYI